MSVSDLSGKNSRRSTPVPVGPLDATEERPIRVLHVEDDPDFAELASKLLEREGPGIEVETAGTADAARSVLDSWDVECVVSDFDLPGADGL